MIQFTLASVALTEEFEDLVMIVAIFQLLDQLPTQRVITGFQHGMHVHGCKSSSKI